MKSQRRSGDWVSTRSGLTWRMTRLMSRRSSMVGCSRPSGCPRKCTSVTPTSAAAARCSRWRSAAMSDRDIERSDPPASPLVAMQ
jgi:hypothetical protein